MLDRVLPMDPALKILAVDDTRSVTLSMGFVFAKPRYEFTCADSGIEGLAKIEADSDPYDVIIVDQEMPCLTGVEFVREIRKRGISAKVIVVADVVSPEIRRAYEGMDVHVMFSKPFDVGRLRSAVDGIGA